MKILYDGYHGVCEAKGCLNASHAAISLYGAEGDLHLCDKCLKNLSEGLDLYYGEKKNEGQ